MEKPKLTDEQLEQLKQQYYSLTEELNIYRKNMRGRKYRDTYPQAEREKHMHQFKFLKFSLLETVKIMIAERHYDEQMAIDFVFNRFLPIGLRLKAMFIPIPDNPLPNGKPNEN